MRHSEDKEIYGYVPHLDSSLSPPYLQILCIYSMQSNGINKNSECDYENNGYVTLLVYVKLEMRKGSFQTRNCQALVHHLTATAVIIGMEQCMQRKAVWRIIRKQSSIYTVVKNHNYTKISCKKTQWARQTFLYY